MRSSLAAFALLALAILPAGCKENGTVEVRSITFNGVKAVAHSRLENALATRESAKLPWGKKRFFDRARFDTDLKRIQAFYADRGFPDARVTSFDAKLNGKQDAVDVTVTIEEGEPIRIAAVEFVGFDTIPSDHLNDLKERMPLKVGDPRDRQLVVTTHEMALNELRDHGFPYAKVTTAESDSGAGRTVTVTYTAAPGQIAYIGTIEISGNRSVADNVIRRELTFKPGDLYQRSEMQKSQRRLYGLELFQFANVEALNPEQEPAEVPVRVTIAEGKHQRVNFGVGYGTDEKARVDAEYHHVNFLGDARSAGAHARWSSLDRGVRVDFTQPYFFRPRYSLNAEGQHWLTFTPAYDSVVTGGKLIGTHRISERMSWSVSETNERVVSSITPSALNDPALRNDLIALGLDPRTGQQAGTLSSLGIDLQRSTADNLLNARRGYEIALHAEEAGRLLPSTFNYYAATLDGRHYLPIGENIVLASRIGVGNIRPVGLDATNVPFSKKFFLGGATTIRGWGRYEVSPLAGGVPVGGDSMFLFSEEIRAAIRGKFGVVLFLDTGNVWADSGGIRLDDLRYAVGPGLRYQTPIGPIRLDFGWQLNPIDGLIVNGSLQNRRWRLHFSIGQAF
jgi:outer membrane protein assembly complex protein YaeT